MAEEHRFQPPRLCANNCGVFGSPATRNLCSKCFHDLQLTEQQSSSAKHALNQTPPGSSHPHVPTTPSLAVEPLDPGRAKEEEEESTAVAQPRGRCLACRKRVGLTGFRCRCGFVFCGTHRYPEQHGCGFDYKGMGKEMIRKANPAVKADKLRKI